MTETMIYTKTEVQRWLSQLGFSEGEYTLPRRGSDLIVQQPYASLGGCWRVSRVTKGYQIATMTGEGGAQ